MGKMEKMEQSVLQQVTELTGMSYQTLKDRWRSLYGTEPPAYKREHIIRRLAYRIQELAFGGLSDSTRIELDRIAAEDEVSPSIRTLRKSKTTRPIAGTCLIRQWNGSRHVVTTTVDGFQYEGRRYKSLSAVARSITGAHWSGPQFFGLRTPKQTKGVS